MFQFFKFILIFNRRVFIAFNLVLYSLLIFFFNVINMANVINYSLYLLFASVILLMKAIYEVTIYKKEIGVLKTLGGGVLQLLALRVVEKAVYIAVAWMLLILLKIILPDAGLKAIITSEIFAIFCIECLITVSYYLFAVLQDITHLLKEE